jgi:hypothetical protein
MRTHVKVLGVLQLIFGSLGVLIGLAAGLGFSMLGAFVGGSGDPDAEIGGAVLGFLGAAAAGLFGVGGLLGIACGIGLLTFKPWGRILGIIFSAISLIEIPLGTALGIYGLWVLFNKETEALFKGELSN